MNADGSAPPPATKRGKRNVAPSYFFSPEHAELYWVLLRQIHALFSDKGLDWRTLTKTWLLFKQVGWPLKLTSFLAPPEEIEVLENQLELGL